MMDVRLLFSRMPRRLRTGGGVALMLAALAHGCATGESVPSQARVVARGDDQDGATSKSSSGSDASGGGGEDSGTPGASGSSGSGEEDASPSEDSSGGDAGSFPCTATCSGCCDTNGYCQTGTEDSICGSGAQSCVDCTLDGQMCQAGLCASASSSSGSSSSGSSGGSSGGYSGYDGGHSRGGSSGGHSSDGGICILGICI
jgi:hypothetical protein